MPKNIKGVNLNDGKDSLPSSIPKKQNKNINPSSNAGLKETYTSIRNRANIVGGLFKKYL